MCRWGHRCSWCLEEVKERELRELTEKLRKYVARNEDKEAVDEVYKQIEERKKRD
jgi:hypothetical protein